MYTIKGKGEDFKSCYIGTMKQHKIIKLNASTKYSFRLAAKNKFGLRYVELLQYLKVYTSIRTWN